MYVISAMYAGELCEILLCKTRGIAEAYRSEWESLGAPYWCTVEFDPYRS